MHSINVLIKNGIYPFGENLDMQNVKVQETQRFTSMDSLKQKKSEMIRKADILKSPYIIQLLAVNQESMYLKYEWQYVPHNFQSYVQTKFTTQSKEIWKMTKTLLLKKMSFELTMLMSYLSKMKIQTDFSEQNIGITNDQKLKFYLSPKTRMGIKSQLSLIAIYGQAKQKVLKEFMAKLQKKQQQQQRNNNNKYDFKATRNYYEQKMNNDSFVQSLSSSTSRSGINIKMPKEKKQSQKKKQRKMSFNNFQPGYSSDVKNNNQRANSSHKHKYSFQYIPPKQQQNNQFQNNFKDYKNFKKPTNYPNETEQEYQNQAINHSKSIKIQLQQKQTLDSKKKRKDSYKVKITTYHEYQLDDCPPDLFKTKNDEDIFEHFARRAQKQQQEKQQEQENNANYAKFKAQNTKESNQFTTEAPSPAFSAGSNISQRIKMARQRSEQALHKIKFMKK